MPVMVVVWLKIRRKAKVKISMVTVEVAGTSMGNVTGGPLDGFGKGGKMIS